MRWSKKYLVLFSTGDFTDQVKSALRGGKLISLGYFSLAMLTLIFYRYIGFDKSRISGPSLLKSKKLIMMKDRPKKIAHPVAWYLY